LQHSHNLIYAEFQYKCVVHILTLSPSLQFRTKREHPQHSVLHSQLSETLSLSLSLCLSLPKVAQNPCQCPNLNKHIAAAAANNWFPQSIHSNPHHQMLSPVTSTCKMVSPRNGCCCCCCCCCLPKVQVPLCIKASLNQTQAPQTHFGPTTRKHIQCTR